jgi:hypothetical protein
MKIGDVIKIRNSKDRLTGVIVDIVDEYAQIWWCVSGMYKPEYKHFNEIEVVEK